MSPGPFDTSSVVHSRSSLRSIHDVYIARLLTVTFTTTAFQTAAAYGCLKPAPTSRLRRAYLHLRHSTVSSDTFLTQSVHGPRCRSHRHTRSDRFARHDGGADD